jgi:hypothetical protein
MLFTLVAGTGLGALAFGRTFSQVHVFQLLILLIS